MKKRSIAKTLGRGLAYFQDTADRIVTFGFKKLKSAGNKKTKKNAHPVQKGAKKTVSFIGEVGTEFYETYEEIKKERGAKRKEKKK